MRVHAHPFRPAALLLILALVFSALGFGPASTVSADDDGGREHKSIASTRGFREAVKLKNIRKHQAAFQAAANASGGSRVAGSAGYDASVAYIVKTLAEKGSHDDDDDDKKRPYFTISTQSFEFAFVGDRTPPQFERITAPAATYVDGIDFGTIQYSGSGDVTAPLFAVDLVVPPVGDANGNTSGCEAADFAGFPAGAIALMQRGTCTFRVKADNARAAGASAVVIFNEGQPGRTAGAFGTLAPPPADYPVLSASFAVGDSLRNGVLNGSTGVTVRVRADTAVETRTTNNLIVETTSGDPNRVIVVGAHVDSVSRGSGMNDNGSGAASILEVARVMQQQNRKVQNKVRFVWWGAEELGLLGSQYYVANLIQAEREKIELNLNFDMVGSPNYARFVYDGDNSAFPVGPGAAVGPQGSGEIERVFHDYFAAKGLASAETPFSGRSDYGPFIAVGIPAGGLFTGAEGIKTPLEAQLFGGIAGEAYDRCYHLACDNFTTTGEPLALKGLDEMSDAIAHSVLYFAQRNFDRKPLLNPAGPVSGQSGTSGGGGLNEVYRFETE